MDVRITMDPRLTKLEKAVDSAYSLGEKWKAVVRDLYPGRCYDCDRCSVRSLNDCLDKQEKEGRVEYWRGDSQTIQREVC